jgi:hypothetical protein
MAWETAVERGCVGVTTRSAIHARDAHLAVLALREQEHFTLELLTPATAPQHPTVTRFCDGISRLAAAGRLVRPA